MVTDKGMAGLVEVEATFGRILAFEDDFITNQIIRFGAHTRPELAFLLSVVRPGDYVFDLGAHIGTYAVPLAQKIGPGGKLLAVEGKPETFAVLELNLTRAGLSAETTAVNALIAPSDRIYEAHTPLGNTGGTYFLPAEAEGGDVDAVTTDELCRSHFTPRVVKIDIEGGEVFAFAGSRLLQTEHPIIYAEVNSPLLERQGASADDLDGLLRGAGYRLFRNVGARNAPHDQFVVAELSTLAIGKRNFDVLAIHQADERLGAVVDSIS